MSRPRLNLLVIRSADLERGAGFYRSLGLDLVRETHGDGPEHLVSASPADGVVFEIDPLSAGQVPTSSTRIGFRVDTVDGLIPALIAAGGRILVPVRDDGNGRRAVLADPDGHRVELLAGP